MASISETGHNKNVANFSSAYQILEEMNSLYNPSNANLKLASLDPFKTDLSKVMSVLNLKKPIYRNVVAERELEIAKLGKLTTRSLNFAKSCGISATDQENLISQTNKIREDSKAKVINPDTAENDTISTSQLSYDSQITNLDTFTSQLESHSEYSPNETDIQILSLRAFHQTLTTLTAEVNLTGNTLITARKNRNDILYHNPQNIIQIIKEIKAYLKSLGTASEPYYKALVKLKFTNLPKK